MHVKARDTKQYLWMTSAIRARELIFHLRLSISSPDPLVYPLYSDFCVSCDSRGREANTYKPTLQGVWITVPGIYTHLSSRLRLHIANWAWIIRIYAGELKLIPHARTSISLQGFELLRCSGSAGVAQAFIMMTDMTTSKCKSDEGNRIHV